MTGFIGRFGLSRCAGAALGLLGGLATFVVLSGAWTLPAAWAQGAQCGPGAIGLHRTHEVDTRGGPRFGANQYPGREFLKDREVVLTFDDGPHKQLTPQILDVLAAHCTKATFFMVGRRALHTPEVVRDVARRGHTIATHSWTHQNQAQLQPEEAKAELELGFSGVQRALGTAAAPFFRFPYLSDPKDSQAHLRARNTAMFSIDVDSYDFKTRSPTVMIRNVMQQLEAKGRGIILFHDIQPSTAGGLNQLLTDMKAKGFRVVHIVPRQAQVTVAHYDKQVERESGGRRFSALPPPVAQRGVVSPYWEVRVFEGPGRAPRVLQPVAQEPGAAAPARLPRSATADLPPAASGVPPPSAAPPIARPSRPSREPDWRTQTFGGQ